MTDFDSIWRTQDEIRTVVNIGDEDHDYEAHVLTSKETNKRAGAICVRPSYFLHHSSYIIAPMHDVVPRAVSAAVRIDTITCITVFHVSFFILKLCFNMTFVETRHSSCSHDSVLATPKVHFFIPHFTFLHSSFYIPHSSFKRYSGARPLTFRCRRRLGCRRCCHRRCCHRRYSPLLGRGWGRFLHWGCGSPRGSPASESSRACR